MALVWYKGIQVVYPATGEGGAALTDALMTLSDRTNLFEYAGSPDTADDGANTGGKDPSAIGGGWDEGSIWRDTTTGQLYINIDNTTNAAVWDPILTAGGDSGVLDHGDLAGLGDDDHPQYLKDISEDASPTLGGNLDIGNYTIEGADSTEFSYLDGVTSDIQTQFDSLVADSGDYLQNIIEDLSPQLGGNLTIGNYTIEGADSTEFSYLDGVTSDIQTQFDSLVADSGDYLQNIIEDLSPQLGGNLTIGNYTIEGADSTEFSYLDGVTSDIQDQFDAIVGDSGNFLQNIVEDLSPQLGGNLDIGSYTIEGVDSTEFSYLDGVTSDVQTQLNASSLTSGTRPFTGVVGGVTPTTSVHLTTKGYVDGLVSGLDWQESVLAQQNAPPGGPSTGDRYLVDTAGSGAWVGQSNNIAQYNGATWDFTAASEGMATWIEDINKLKTYNGAAWVLFGSTVDHGNLTGLGDDDHTQYLKNTVEDITPQLGGNLDIQTFSIEGVNATRFGYLTTISSNVQTQLNGKAPISHSHTESDISDLGSYLENVIEDITPQLGGNLDLLTRKIYTSSSNQDIIIEPSGTGALQGTSTGDARGNYVVDWQLNRSVDSAVASAQYATICGGLNNINDGEYSVIGGGVNNTLTGIRATIAGGSANTLNALWGTISGGYNNSLMDSTDNGVIGGGYSNEIRNDNTADTAYYSVIAGGFNNDIDGKSGFSAIGGGQSNAIDNGTNGAYGSVISGGQSNRIGANSTAEGARYSTIGGGLSNAIRNQIESAGICGYSTIGGGFNNEMDGFVHSSVIAGGYQNIIRHVGVSIENTISGGKFNRIGSDTNQSGVVQSAVIAGGTLNVVSRVGTAPVIGGGGNNTIDNGTLYAAYSTVSGGRFNTIGGSVSGSASYTVIAGGCSNTASHVYATISGGRDNEIYNGSGASSWPTIGGGYNNRIGQDTAGSATNASTICGGYSNRINGGYGGIAGGQDHQINGDWGFIGGGNGNIITLTNYGTIGGGINNRVNAARSAICGGDSGTTAGARCFIGAGEANYCAGANASIVGGYQNKTGASYSVVAGGQYNETTAAATYGFIGAGRNNEVAASLSAVVAGDSCVCRSAACIIGAGVFSEIQGSASYCGILSGYSNRIHTGAAYAVIGAGRLNNVYNDYGCIFGGYNNTSEGTYNFIGAGYQNQILGATGSAYAFIGAGRDNVCGETDTATYGTIAGGNANRIDGTFSFIGGGTHNYIRLEGTTCHRNIITGGYYNRIGSDTALTGNVTYCNISGGYYNHIGGGTNNNIAGGGNNVMEDSGQTYCGILSGRTAVMSGTCSRSVICGGQDNEMVTANYAFLGGGASNVFNHEFGRGALVGGTSNEIHDRYCFLGAGTNNIIKDNTSTNAAQGVIVGGSFNRIGSDSATSGEIYNSFIGGGKSNVIRNQYTTHDNSYGVICGGESNRIDYFSGHSFIGGGWTNEIYGREQLACVIAGGRGNKISSLPGWNSYAIIVGGRNNIIGNPIGGSSSGCYSAFIGGGNGNLIGTDTGLQKTYYATIVGGILNKINTGGFRCFIGTGNELVIDPNGFRGDYNAIICGNESLIGGPDATGDILASVIGGGWDNKITNSLSSDSANYNVISGGSQHEINSAIKSSIGGGNANKIYKTKSGGLLQYCSIGGGKANLIIHYAQNSTISGGNSNVINGDSGNAQHCTIGGGLGNTIGSFDTLGWIYGSTIGGGVNNLIDNTLTSSDTRWNTIGGGRENVIEDAEYGTIPGGAYAKVDRYGEMAYASGRFSSDGDAQTMVMVMRRATATTAFQNLFLDGNTVQESIVMKDNDCFSFHVLVSARGETSGDCAGWEHTGCVECTSGTTTLFVNGDSAAGTTNLGYDAGASGWDSKIVVTANRLHIQCSHIGSAETVRYVARIQVCKVNG